MWIFRILRTILAKQEATLAAIDDLNAAVTAIQTSVTNLQATAATVVADIQALIAAQGQNNDQAIEDAVAKLTASGAALDKANSDLTAAEPPA